MGVDVYSVVVGGFRVRQGQVTSYSHALNAIILRERSLSHPRSFMFM
jgi:hypothetical protein